MNYTPPPQSFEDFDERITRVEQRTQALHAVVQEQVKAIALLTQAITGKKIEVANDPDP